MSTSQQQHTTGVVIVCSGCRLCPPHRVHLERTVEPVSGVMAVAEEAMAAGGVARPPSVPAGRAVAA
jgi:hypothetical protein